MQSKQQRAALIAQEVVACAVTIPTVHEPFPFELRRVPLPAVWRIPTDHEVDAAVRAVLEKMGEQVVYRLTEDVVTAAVIAALPAGIPAAVVAVLVAGVMRSARPHIEHYAPSEALVVVGAIALVAALATMLLSRRSATT
jgi:hypothetical protein